MSISLYRKYRPQTFSDVIGQQHIVQTLSNAIIHDRIAHAYLFTGPRGTGKTTMARIFAKTINCLSQQNETAADQNQHQAIPCMQCEICKNISEGKSLDIFEIDAASNTGVDNIRELRENIKFPPSQAKYKVYIIDEVHMLSTGAFNALLKTLEEPPAHAIFILATTEIHKVPETIISRCQRFDFTRLSLDHIIEKLSLIAKSEEIKIEKSALEMIAIAAEGGMRDAESLFSQVIALEDKNITAKEVEEILGTTQRQSLEQLAAFLFAKETTKALELINQISQDGYDLNIFNKSFLNYLRQIMLTTVDEKLAKLFSHELTTDQSKDLIELAKKHNPAEILFAIQCFSEIQGKIKSSFIPQLPLEMAIVKAISPMEYETKNPVLSQASAPLQNQPNQAPKAPQTSEMAHSSIETSRSVQMAPPSKEPQAKPEIQTPVEPQIILNEAQIADSNFTLNDVKKNWERFITEIKAKNHSLSAFLQSCQPVKVEAGLITIATKFVFHKDKLNEYGSKLTLEEVFGNILRLRLLIKVITAQEAGVTISSSLNQHANSSAAEIKPSETSSLLTDAMGIMGGSFVE